MWFSVGYVGHMQEKKQDVNKLSVNDVINQISSEWRRYIYSKVDLRKVSINQRALMSQLIHALSHEMT